MKNILHTFLNEKVSFPTSPIYINANNAFRSAQESALLPVCRITPTNTLDVSTALKILGQEGAEFAIMSGGHSMYSYIFELLLFAGWVLEGWRLGVTRVRRDQSVQ
jgi:hypothetical protein